MSPRWKYVSAAEFAGLCQWSLTTTTGGSFDSLLAQTTGNGQTQQHSLQQQLDASDIASVQGSETQEQSTSTQTSQTFEGQTSEEQDDLSSADGSEDKEEGNTSRV
ncbi:hypothetical protein CC79DRAFT_1362253 [Sarocladium strictum]